MDNQRLLNKKNELERLLHEKQEEQMTTMGAEQELSMYDQHPADMGTELFEKEKNLGLLELYEYELEKVNDALEKMQEGKYGTCELCGKAIEERRLETLVNTTICAQCAHQYQHRVNRMDIPQEHEVARNIADRGETIEIAGYDFYDD